MKGWCDEQADLSRAMLHHVSQRSTLKIQPKWYTALGLESEILPISDEKQLDLEESFAHSAEVEKDEELAELAKTRKAHAPEAEGIGRNSEYTYDSDRHTFQFSKTKTKNQRHCIARAFRKGLLALCRQGRTPNSRICRRRHARNMEVTVGEYRNFQEKKLSSGAGGSVNDGNKNRTLWHGRYKGEDIHVRLDEDWDELARTMWT